MSGTSVAVLYELISKGVRDYVHKNEWVINYSQTAGSNNIYQILEDCKSQALDLLYKYVPNAFNKDHNISTKNYNGSLKQKLCDVLELTAKKVQAGKSFLQSNDKKLAEMDVSKKETDEIQDMISAFLNAVGNSCTFALEYLQHEELQYSKDAHELDEKLASTLDMLNWLLSPNDDMLPVISAVVSYEIDVANKTHNRTLCISEVQELCSYLLKVIFELQADMFMEQRSRQYTKKVCEARVPESYSLRLTQLLTTAIKNIQRDNETFAESEARLNNYEREISALKENVETIKNDIFRSYYMPSRALASVGQTAKAFLPSGMGNQVSGLIGYAENEYVNGIIRELTDLKTKAETQRKLGHSKMLLNRIG